MTTKRKARKAPAQPVQTTPTGYEIPVPQRSDVLKALQKVARPQKAEATETAPKS
jgi:hypothetical protein